MHIFEVVFGLKVNFNKSQVGARGYEVNTNILSKCLNCGRMEFPFKYLGLRIGGNPRKVEFWKPIIYKIKSRVSTWKGRLLSMARRFFLIKLVINALPLFYMSFFKVPITVCKVIRRIQAKFL